MFSEKRPKLNLTKNKTDLIIETITYLFVFGCFALVALNYNALPDKVPGHMDLAGKVNRYDSKETLWILPILNAILVFGMFYLNKFPHVFNYTVKITSENAEKQYKSATQLIRIVNLLMSILFFAICYQIVSIGLYGENKPPIVTTYIINTIIIALTVFPLILVILNLWKQKGS